ncbi:MAG: hypothetical protein U1E53_04695 [Dongiaceae bacterium]
MIRPDPGRYGYFDIQNSENDNLFYQATLGLEALSVDWDFRERAILFNAGGQSVDNGDGHLEINGATIGITTTRRSRRRVGRRGDGGCRSSRRTATWTSASSSAATSSLHPRRR